MENRRRLLLTVDDVSVLTGWDRKQIYKRGPVLPGYVKIPPRTIRFKRGPLLRWLEEDDGAADNGGNNPAR